MKIDDVRKLSDLLGEQTEENSRKMMERLRELGIDPANIYQEMEMSSRYVDTHRDVSYSNTQVNLHSHSYYELLYCHTSSGVEYLIGSDRYRLLRGDIIYVPPGVSHRPILPENMKEPYIRDVIWLSEDFINAIKPAMQDKPDIDWRFTGPLRTAGTQWEYIGQLFRAGVKESEERKHGWENVVIGNTMIILTKLQRAYIDQTAGFLKTEKRELLDEITEYIEEHYARHLTLGDFARRFYVSESTVSHLFKQKMGVSVYHYVTQRRLIAAKNLILQGAALDSIAEQVGFLDYSSFYRAFKGAFGISPRQFRMQNAVKE